MASIKYKRYKQVVQYGWKDAKEISNMPEVNRSRLSVFFDIIRCFCKYYFFSNQYKDNKVWKLDEEERKAICLDIGAKNREKDKWVNFYRENWKFLSKYTSLKWQKPALHERRQKKYQEHYHFQYPVSVQYGVKLIAEHEKLGDLYVGKDCLFAREVDIDFTGGIYIGNHVKLSESTKILTHNHDFDLLKPENDALILSPLKIEDYVNFGAKSVILPGVGSIGRGSMICASAVVKKKVPPYAIVMGNPAIVVGFRYTPDVIAEFEAGIYEESERIPIDVLKDNYNKYYLSRIKDIQNFLNSALF